MILHQPKCKEIQVLPKDLLLSDSITIKRDGWRCRIIYGKDRSVVAMGRTKSLLPYLENREWFQQIVNNSQPNTVYDGELWARGIPASSVPTLLRDPASPLLYTIFAVPIFAGEDLRMQTGRDHRIAISGFGLHARHSESHYTLSDLSCIAGYKIGPGEDIRHLAASLAVEGFVLKRRAYSEWYKIKAKHTVDLVVTGWTPGTGMYRGQIGSLVVSAYREETGVLYEVGRCGGLDEETRALHPPSLIGQVVEVEHNGILAKGGLRHPRFIRFRDDKPAKECVL